MEIWGNDGFCGKWASGHMAKEHSGQMGTEGNDGDLGLIGSWRNEYLGQWALGQMGI